MKSPYDIIQRPRLTEKGSHLQANGNAYVFSVAQDANKLEIRQAVEKLFSVKVLKVNTMNCFGKMRRQYTKQRGRTPNWKKAVVTLKKGDKIDFGV